MFWITGIMVATNGMLSMIADRMAETHSIARPRSCMSPPLIPISQSARILSRPACSTPATTMNRPTKKKIVIHSTSLKLSIR